VSVHDVVFEMEAGEKLRYGDDVTSDGAGRCVKARRGQPVLGRCVSDSRLEEVEPTTV